MNLIDHTFTKEEVIDLAIWKLKNSFVPIKEEEMEQKWNKVRELKLLNNQEDLLAELLNKIYFKDKLNKQELIPQGKNLRVEILGVLQDSSNQSQELQSFCEWLVNFHNINQLNSFLISKLELENEPMKEPNSDLIIEESSEHEVKLKFEENNELKVELQVEGDQQQGAIQEAESELIDSDKQENNEENTQEVASEYTPILGKSIWNNLPVEEGPDKHDDSFHKSLEENGLQFIAARARGKKHKHEGTNCDDWFEFITLGKWQIIAVSDGAGSKKYSRVGAKVGCEAAVEHLSKSLVNHSLVERETWTNEDFSRDQITGKFMKDDIEYVQSAIHDAMRYARDEIENAALVRSKGEDKERYQEILGREIQFNDLSATLLIAVHCSVPYKGQLYSLVLTSQIGDGMLAVIHQSNELELLGIPDSGEFSGETDFITSIRTSGKQYLTGKTRGTFGRIKLLMAMTDGISDDYYPNHPGLIDLYNHLISQNVLSDQPIEKADLNREISFLAPESNLTTADEKLLHMIDNYQLRGSFDDRTIVLLKKGD